MSQPYYQDNHIKLYNADSRLMPDITDESIQCVVTSPPYWGLRKYSGEQDLIWGGQPDCQHEWGNSIETGDNRYRGENAIVGGNHNAAVWGGGKMLSQFYSLCGAWRGAYGLEPTTEMYVHHTIEIMREIRRVLRKDGIVFWNIGDSYAGNGQGWSNQPCKQQTNVGAYCDIKESWESKPGFEIVKTNGILKPKDLCLIPFRVALAAQEDGWWMRSDIIWNKPNPMPESVKDRPTKTHEHILMLTKSARYYWDADAVREDYKKSSIDRADGSMVTTSNPDRPVGFKRILSTGANLRSVWTFPNTPYPEAHFAVFPEKLPEICIKAASKEGDIVLDPFAGAGTTLWVAKKLNRQAIGYELSEEYCRLIIKRNRQQVII